MNDLNNLDGYQPNIMKIQNQKWPLLNLAITWLNDQIKKNGNQIIHHYLDLKMKNQGVSHNDIEIWSNISQLYILRCLAWFMIKSNLKKILIAWRRYLKQLKSETFILSLEQQWLSSLEIGRSRASPRYKLH